MWNTARQDCDEFVPILNKSNVNKVTVPNDLVGGTMKLKIRAFNKCDLPGDFSRVLVLTLTT